MHIGDGWRRRFGKSPPPISSGKTARRQQDGFFRKQRSAASRFFPKEKLDEIQSHVDALFKDQPEIPFIKKGDTGLAAKEVIDRSRYGNFFDELSIDYENSYVNVSKPRTEEGWHYDHSEYALIVPVFLKNTDQGTVYSHSLGSDKGLLKKVTTALNFLTIFLARRKETFRTNDGLLIP